MMGFSFRVYSYAITPSPPLPYGQLNGVENVYWSHLPFFISYAVHMHSPDSLIHATQLLIITIIYLYIYCSS